MASLRLDAFILFGALAGGAACKTGPDDGCAGTLSCDGTASIDGGGASAGGEGGAPEAAGSRGDPARGGASGGPGGARPGDDAGGALPNGRAGAAPGGAGGLSAEVRAGALLPGAGGTSGTVSGAGAGGAGGAENASDFGPCEVDGALGCAGPAGVAALLCRNGAWILRQTCDPAERCDGASGTCMPVAPGCAELEPGEAFCSTGQVLTTCGPDLVTTEDTPCEARCDESALACAEPACGDGVLHDDEQCDDGNDDAGDGCTPDCRHEAVALALGSIHSCALGANGAVRCWGGNASGQLGLGDTQGHGDEPSEMGEALTAVNLGEGRQARALAAGAAHTCALLEDGAVKCWGENARGQLGLGDTQGRGDEPGEMGDALHTVDLGVGRTAVSLAAGGHNTCALLDVGTIVCWGANEYSQCGSSSSPAIGDEPGEMGGTLIRIDPPEPARSLSVGSGHVCAATTAGAVYCWGDNGGGQLGVGLDEALDGAVDEVREGLLAVDLGADRTAMTVGMGTCNYGYKSESAPFSCAIRDDGALRCWGYLGFLLADAGEVGSEPNQMGAALPAFALPPGRAAVALEAGCRHVCVLEDDGGVHCWGATDVFAGGHDPVAAGIVPDAVPLGKGRRAKALAASGSHTCVLLDEGSVKCWGLNGSGQLGLGDVTERGNVVTALGDALPPVSLTF